MKALRTVLWLLVLVIVVAFTVANWVPVQVRIWQGLVLDTKLPALVVAAFLLGLVPMWLLHRAMRWRLARRIANLEATLTSQAGASLTSTHLDAAAASPARTTDTP